MSQPTKTSVEPSLVARVSGALRYAVTGRFPEGWFGPGEPMLPVAPPEQVAGRRFDFPVAFNTRLTPRAEEAVSFAQMRQLADACDVLRLVIETRKDQMAKLKWKIVPVNEEQDPDDRCEALTAFFRSPDREHTWDDWLRMLLEDLLVIDAPTLYARRTNGGDLYALEPVDGATIKRVLDEFGRTPLPPLPAYQQIIKGLPAIDYTREELLYRPRNLRTHKVYGYSPVEQIIITVNLALRRAANQLSYYTEGNTPNLVFGVPENWQPDQIKAFQDWWDILNSGESKHKARFVPGGVKPFDTKDQLLKDEFDEWLARIVCFAFSINPTPFIKQQNRATAENAHQQAISEGLAPNMQWVKSTVDAAIQRPEMFGFADLHFVWDEEEEQDPNVASQIDDRNVRNGSMTIDEARARRGEEPLPNGLGKEPMIVTGSGAVLLKDVLNPPPPPPMLAPPGVPGKPPAPGQDDPAKPADDAGKYLGSTWGKKKVL